MPRLPFHPTPDQLAALTDDLASPDLSLREIAARHNTTLDALNLYLVSAPALEHVATLELTAAVRTRLAAVSHLHRAVATLTELLDDYSSAGGTALRAVRETPAPTTNASTSAAAPTPPALPSTLLLAERQRDRARRAAYLLFRLATFTPRPLAGLSAPVRATESVGSATRSVPGTNAHASPAPRPPRDPASRALELLAAVGDSAPARNTKATPGATPSPAPGALPIDDSPAALLSSHAAAPFVLAPRSPKQSRPANQPRTARDLVATAGGAP